ncbi:MAG TPA: hypothetical protein PLO51_02175 [Candidatus Micrarchaeota archaeon]|nr:hypothetical protein [Candidatus Micrarchaeota archaeon]
MAKNNRNPGALGKQAGKAPAARQAAGKSMAAGQAAVSSTSQPAQGTVRIFGISVSKKTAYLNLFVMAIFAMLVIAFMLLIRTSQAVEVSESAYQRTANLALRAGENYTYRITSDSGNSTAIFTVSDADSCKLVQMSSEGVDLMAFCLDYDGKALVSGFTQEQRGNQVLEALANSSLGMPNMPLKPWMLGLGNDSFHYIANITYVTRTSGIMESEGTVGSEVFEAIALGKGERLGRGAYKVLVRSTTLAGTSESTIWVDAQKRVMLEMTGENESIVLVSAPFNLTGGK